MKITAALVVGIALAITTTASAQDFKPVRGGQAIKVTPTMGITQEDLVVPAGCSKTFVKLTPYAKKIGVISIITFTCPN